MTASVLAWAAKDPRRLAAIAGGVECSYAALADRVYEVMRGLRAQGVACGDRVAVVAPHDLQTVIDVLGVIESGATVVPLHARWTKAAIEAALDGVGARYVVSGATITRRAVASRDTSHEVAGDADLAIVHTSGSTGAARGVRLSHVSFGASAAASALNLARRPSGNEGGGASEPDRWLLCLPLAHIGGLSIVTRAVAAGDCVVVPELPRAGGLLADAATIARSVERDRVTIASFVPTVLDAVMARAESFEVPRVLRALLLGGARAPQPLVRRACDRGWPVLRTYGLTEACSQVATQPIDDAGRAIDDCGRGLAGIDVCTRADGSIGVRGAVVATGVVGSDAALTDRDGWLWTNDVGEIDARGRLRVVGRRSEMIVTGGENVWPGEVERALESIPEVEGACVLGVEDARWGEIVAAVIATGGRSSDGARLAAAAAEQLAPHARPRRWLFVDALPLGATGKVDRAIASALVTKAGVAM